VERGRPPVAAARRDVHRSTSTLELKSQMRYQGRLNDWNDTKGFGFILPNGGGPKVFIHISAFGTRLRRPVLGDLVTYELGADARGRPKANAARLVSDPRRIKRESRAIGIGAVAVAVAIVAFVVYVAFVRFTHPNSTMSASVYKIFFARDALRSDSTFQCVSEKNSCSRMSSCAEAFFHQEICRVPGMDGDRDGIPCERQLCN